MLGLLKHQKGIFFLWGFDVVLPLYLNSAWTQTKFNGQNVRHVFSRRLHFAGVLWLLTQIIIFLVHWTFMTAAARLVVVIL